MAKWLKKSEQPESSSPQDDKSPPDILDFLEVIIRDLRVRLQEKRIPWPSEVPHASSEAAEWWVRMQEPPNPDYDAPRQVRVITNSDRNAYRWECPYHLRLAATLRRYVMLPPDHRELIEAAREDGVFWRGDEVKRGNKPGFFMRVYDETLKMREIGATRYIDESRRENGLLARIPR